jgi:hypothetical protein
MKAFKNFNSINIPSFTLLIIMLSVCAWSQTSIYGLQGHAWVPDAWTQKVQRYGFATDPFGKKVALRAVFLESRRLELALSTIYGMVDDKEGYGEKRNDDFIIPSVKISVIESHESLRSMAYSVGYMRPYGFMIFGSWAFRLPLVSPAITGGIGIPSISFSPLYSFASVSLRMSNLKRDPLPLRFFGQGALALHTESLGSFYESFLAYGMALDIGRHIALEAFYRIDGMTYHAITVDESKGLPLVGQNTGGKMFLRLQISFDAFGFENNSEQSVTLRSERGK